MASIPQVAQAMQDVLTETANRAARATGMIQRERAISGAQFVQTLVFGWLAEPTAILEELVTMAAALGVTITPQGLSARFTPAAVACLRQVVEAAIGQVIAADPLTIPLLARFPAVLLQDSTTISLPAVLADQFRGCGGNPGQGTAALKAQVRLELRTGQVAGPLFQDGRASDRAVAFRERPVVGSVVLRDLGYFHLDDMAADARTGRFWVSRLKAFTALFAAGERLDLLVLLKACPTETLDLPVAIGSTQRIAGRLLAVRVPQEVADQRRRRMQQAARKKGRQVSALQLALCAWTLVVTNVPADQLTLIEALVLLKLRWQLELLFKLWKSHGHVDESRGHRPERVLAEVYAKFVGMLIQHWLLLTGCWHAPDRSLPKAAKVVRAAARSLGCALASPRRLRAALRALMADLARAGRQRRRIRHPNAYQLLQDPALLSLT